MKVMVHSLKKMHKLLLSILFKISSKQKFVLNITGVEKKRRKKLVFT